MRIWQILFALVLILSSALGLLIMAGGARDLLSPPLQAELTVQDFPTPPGMAVDPTKVATYMAKELQQRADDDLAIHMLLKSDMLQNIPELSALVDLGSFHRTVSGSVTSANAAGDVALTAPGALLAVVDGQK